LPEVRRYAVTENPPPKLFLRQPPPTPASSPSSAEVLPAR
jgi:hypothetical protein